MGRVLKPRCARGQQCVHVLKAGSDGPPIVSNAGDICNLCVREGYTLNDVPASSLESQMKKKRCPSCRNEFGDPRECQRLVPIGRVIRILGDNECLCAHCNGGIRSGADLRYRLPTREDLSLADPHGFDELFRAAKVLLNECAEKNEENRIIPTLALAYQLCHRVRRLVKQKERLVELWGDRQVWDQEADSFARRYSGLRLKQAALGVLILERQQVSVRIEKGITHNNPVAVIVSVYPHQTSLARAKKVEAMYAERLAGMEISCEEQHRAKLSFFFRDDRLELDITPGTITEEISEPRAGWRTAKASYPQPRLVGNLYAVLAKEFVKNLKIRTSSGPPFTKNFVPACVAFFLSEYGIRRDRIERLLDDHKLRNVGASTTQLWRDVPKKTMVHDPLLDTSRTLFYEGYEA
jgi:hypothetical protein